MKKIYFFFLALIWQTLTAQNLEFENTEISVLTVGTADESHSLYGHTAIRITNHSLQIDQVYNYGMFDFSTPNFIGRFIKGDLQYFAGAYPYADFEYSYRIENRSIYEQKLHLSHSQKKALYKVLEEDISGDSKFYTYKFIYRNCTTKVVDVINSSFNEKIIKNNSNPTVSYREVLYPYAEHHFFQKLGINIIFGTQVDQPATLLFLPFDLKNKLDTTEYHSTPLVSKNKTLFEANRIPRTVWWDSIYTIIFVLAFIVILRNKIVTNIYFFLVGLIGLFFSVVGFYSFHEEIAWNYNILLFNPLLLLLIFFRGKTHQNIFLWTSFITLGSLVVYLLYMLQKIHLAIVWPFIIANSILVIRGLLTYSKKEKD